MTGWFGGLFGGNSDDDYSEDDKERLKDERLKDKNPEEEDEQIEQWRKWNNEGVSDARGWDRPKDGGKGWWG